MDPNILTGLAEASGEEVVVQNDCGPNGLRNFTEMIRSIPGGRSHAGRSPRWVCEENKQHKGPPA